MKAFSGLRRTDFQWHRTDPGPRAMEGKRVSVIGGTNGIGRALALTMVEHGAEVLVVGRSFRDKGISNVSFIQADLSLMREARSVAQQLPAETLDFLIFTSGIMAANRRAASLEGIELDLAVSYLNRFVMVREMAPRLGRRRHQAQCKPRVFVWGFPGTNQKGNLGDFNSERSYSLMAAHSNTVIGNEALVLDGAARYPEVNFYGLNPGLIKSGIRSNTLGEGSLGLKFTEWLIGALFPNAEEYGRRMLPLLISPDIESHSGAMFNRHGAPIHASESLLNGPALTDVMEQSQVLANKALA